MTRIAWIVVAVIAVLCLIVLLFTLLNARSPQEGAMMATLAVAFTVVPYVLARAIEALKGR